MPTLGVDRRSERIADTAHLGPLDVERLQDALQLAQLSVGLSDPNPRVGCVIGTECGQVFGRGHTQAAGQAHAEIMALRDARGEVRDVRGATAWVTLEPCAHHGRTPPCCESLVAAGIARVVVAIEDPFPQVAGRGLAHLRAAGVEVVVAGGAFASASRELNIGFFSRMERGRPWLRMKVAVSLDGRTALPNGRSQWITGAEARADGHAWRRRAGVILTGIGTVLADDPRLDVRQAETTLQPLRAVLDSGARLPPRARIAAPPGRVLVYVGAGAPEFAADGEAAIETVRVPLRGSRIDLAAVLADMHSRSINEIHVEAGATLNGALLEEGWVDELLAYVAPCLLGAGRSLADLPLIDSLAEARRFYIHDTDRLGPDLRLRLRREPG